MLHGLAARPWPRRCKALSSRLDSHSCYPGEVSELEGGGLLEVGVGHVEHQTGGRQETWVLLGTASRICSVTLTKQGPEFL